MQNDIVEAFRKVAPPGLLEGARRNECGDLLLALRAPANDGRRLLVQIDVDYDEVIVGFGGGHSHGGAWREAEDPDHRFARTLGLLEQIRAERVVGYRRPDGGGGLIGSDDIGELPADATIRSWRGSYDRDGKSDYRGW